jgi:hypothetical protein
MLIENALSDAVCFFHMDALSSAVGLKVDFDMNLLVIASGLYRLMAKRMRGYADAQARQIFRDLIDTPADATVTRERDRRELPSPCPPANHPGFRTTRSASRGPVVEWPCATLDNLITTRAARC